MAELMEDEEVLVRIEGIDMMTEYLTLFKREQVLQDYAPKV